MRGRSCSRFLQRLLDSDPTYLPWLADHFQTPSSRTEIEIWLNEFPQTDDIELARALRKLRKRVMLKLMMRDLGGLANLNEVMEITSALAEICVQRAQTVLMQNLTEQFGHPIGELSGKPQQLLILGMGKLGGGELNVSSDIDLIFIYPENGETDGTRRISNSDFFTRLGKRLIAAINELTADGHVFRVDMRLRPYGDSGPLVMSFAALEEYLLTQGREWERYAWIKARVISPPDCPDCDDLMSFARPFVFRKYLDFGAFESMRKLHAQIRQEVARRDRVNNIKLGPGGIREIEFIAQVFQLIRGGRDAELRIRPTQAVLRQLATKEQLDKFAVIELDNAYQFLRNLEHRLQYLDDQQTQDLPTDLDNQNIVAAAMNFASYADFLRVLDQHRDIVSRHFSQIFSIEVVESTDSIAWHDGSQPDVLIQELTQRGYQNPSALAEQLLAIRNSNRFKQLPDISRDRIERIVPQFVSACQALAQRDVALSRLLKLLDQISRRSTYLAFLIEHPQALERLARFAGASEWACDYLGQHPGLLDELLDAREIYSAPDWFKLDAELGRQLLENQNDLEWQMDVLRHFKQAQTFRLLAMDLQGLLPLEILSDHLSDLADLILRHVLQICWHDAKKKHCDSPQFSIVAYGKLGGRELGYDSDLDLIFLYDDDHPDAGENYARLAKRINTVLSSYTSAGRLYETDLRLRPNGEGGLLVSSVVAFNEYQQQHAWVWEHQALTRARCSAGLLSIKTRFDEIRAAVLSQTRDINSLRDEVVKMRQKMHDGHPNNSTLFDIKQDNGGMVDIEFMVQFLVLAHAHRYPELTANSGNIALLESAAKLGLISQQDSDLVRDIYRELRRLQHQMRLNNQTPCRVEPDKIDTRAVTALWQKLFAD
ncbi:MAG: glutamate-ammonia-ligase adenylyltransferase [Pseudomonadota bacterium]